MPDEKIETLITTIKIDRTTLNKLKKFREYRRETYNDLIEKLINKIEYQQNQT